MKIFKKSLPRATAFLFIFTLICGVLYTGIITAISHLLFADRANGSMIEVNGKKYGSELLGQQYTDDAHMWGRIMKIDTSTFQDQDGNRLMYSAPSNLSPASKEYQKLAAERVEKIKAAHPEKGEEPIPVDLITCSGSGLDPEISVAAAEYQAERLAQNHHMTTAQIQDIIDQCTSHRFLGILGEERVNVLKVNLMLDGILS